MKKINIDDIEAVIMVKLLGDIYDFLKNKDLLNDFICEYGNIYLRIFNEVENNLYLYNIVREKIKDL